VGRIFPGSGKRSFSFVEGRSDVIVPLLYKEPEFYPQLKAFVGWSEGEYELL